MVARQQSDCARNALRKFRRYRPASGSLSCHRGSKQVAATEDILIDWHFRAVGHVIKASISAMGVGAGCALRKRKQLCRKARSLQRATIVGEIRSGGFMAECEFGCASGIRNQGGPLVSSEFCAIRSGENRRGWPPNRKTIAACSALCRVAQARCKHGLCSRIASKWSGNI